MLFCSLILKERNRSFAVLLSVAGAALLLSSVISQVFQLTDKLKDITSFSPSSEAYIRIMLKALGVTLITQFVSDICRDNGENALASMTETASKVVVITMLFPLFDTIIGIVGGLVK